MRLSRATMRARRPRSAVNLSGTTWSGAPIVSKNSARDVPQRLWGAGNQGAAAKAAFVDLVLARATRLLGEAADSCCFIVHDIQDREEFGGVENSPDPLPHAAESDHTALVAKSRISCQEYP